MSEIGCNTVVCVVKVGYAIFSEGPLNSLMLSYTSIESCALRGYEFFRLELTLLDTLIFFTIEGLVLLLLYVKS